MRSYIRIIILAVVTFTMNSCWEHLAPQSTPSIIVSNLYINPIFSGDTLVGAQDTLRFSNDPITGQKITDTMRLGDTAVMAGLFTSYHNNLTTIVTKADTNKINFWYAVDMSTPENQKLLSESSNPAKGYLLFKGLCQQYTFPIFFVPQKAGSHAIQIGVSSDSQFPNNSATFSIPVE